MLISPETLEGLELSKTYKIIFFQNGDFNNHFFNVIIE